MGKSQNDFAKLNGLKMKT